MTNSRLVRRSAITAAVVAVGVANHPTNASVLTASDGAGGDRLGGSVSQSGTTGLVGAFTDDVGSNTDQGSAYVFRSLDTAAGSVTQNVKLTASDGEANDVFGSSVSLSGSTGLVGAFGDDTLRGSAYLFRDLDTATGTGTPATVTQDVKLTASDAGVGDRLGASVSLLGTTGLVGAWGDNSSRGSAYLYRNLDTATGTITQNVKLTASDGASGDQFGYSVSLSGTSGLLGASRDDTLRGSAYLFRNLDTATGTITQNVKLTASDGASGDQFGYSVSLSASTGLVGAYVDDIGSIANQGSAYLYRNLDTATGTITQNVKLTASDGNTNDQFGFSVSLSGTTALVGANRKGGFQGSAYLFRNLDTAAGTITQNVKLTASDGTTNDQFGISVSLSGDLFTIGASGNTTTATGKAYTGTVSSVTTLDAGSASRTIDGISFVSQDDWIIGQTTSGNQVTLIAGNTGNVTASGKSVYIGKDAGSNNNALVIAGTLTANQVNVGATGNTGNTLTVNGTLNGGGTVTVASGSTLNGAGTITGNVTSAGQIAPGNSPGTLAITGNLTHTGTLAMEIASLASFDQLNLTGTFNAGGTIAVDLLGSYTPSEGDSFDLMDFASLTDNGYTFDFSQATLPSGLAWDTSSFATTGTLSVTAVPEPASLALIGLGGFGLTRRRIRSR